MDKMRIAVLASILWYAIGATVPSAMAQSTRRPLAVEEFLTLERPSEPAISPDGKTVVYTVTTTDLAANRRKQDLWLVLSAGGAPRRISDDSLGGRSARWSPD